VFTALVVALRIVANPLANVFQKRLVQGAIHPLVVIGMTHALLTVVVLPFVARVRWHALAPAFWSNMTLCAVLAVAGNALLVAALHRTDLSLLGPINAYKAVLSLALATVVLGEVPSAFGVLGVALIVLGSALVVDRAPGQQRVHAVARLFGDRGVQLRLAALVCSATEAVFLKRAQAYASPFTTFLAWVFLGVVPAALAAVLLVRRDVRVQLERLRREWPSYGALAITTGAMQLATLLAFRALPVGYALALFQLSAVVSVLLGARYFAERSIRRRLAGSAVMVAGAALIVTLGAAH
jgi:drug/metabolite transporter (DMT)-like permease